MTLKGIPEMGNTKPLIMALLLSKVLPATISNSFDQFRQGHHHGWKTSRFKGWKCIIETDIKYLLQNQVHKRQFLCDKAWPVKTGACQKIQH